MSTKQAFDSAMVEVQKTLQAKIEELEVLKKQGAELARNQELIRARVEQLQKALEAALATRYVECPGCGAEVEVKP